MIKVRAATSLLVTVLVMVIILFSAGTVKAQDPLPPPDYDQELTPPEGEGKSFMAPGASSKLDSSSVPPSGTSEPSSSFYYPPRPKMPPSILSANFIDDAGRVRSQFSNEPFYLRIQINSPGYFYLAEYFPSGSGMSPHWLMYRYNLNSAGSWTLGPFYPETYEPVGQHIWKMWLYASGAWAQTSSRFVYQPSPVAYPYPLPTPLVTPETNSWGTLQITIVMVLVGALGITLGMLISGRRRYSS